MIGYNPKELKELKKIHEELEGERLYYIVKELSRLFSRKAMLAWFEDIQEQYDKYLYEKPDSKEVMEQVVQEFRLAVSRMNLIRNQADLSQLDLDELLDRSQRVSIALRACWIGSAFTNKAHIPPEKRERYVLLSMMQNDLRAAICSYVNSKAS